MKRARISPQSDKMKQWLSDYRILKKAVTPKECARCGMKGSGWEDEGGDFQPHHPYRRSERWRMLAFVPVCRECHETIEHDSTQAKVDGWIVKPQQFDIFGNQRARQ